jgi:hypothetical protein
MKQKDHQTYEDLENIEIICEVGTGVFYLNHSPYDAYSTATAQMHSALVSIYRSLRNGYKTLLAAASPETEFAAETLQL